MVIGLDTNFFIYLFQHHPEFEAETKKFVKVLAKRGNGGLTSVLSLLEFLSFDEEESTIKFLRTAFWELPNLKAFDVNPEIAEIAARISW